MTKPIKKLKWTVEFEISENWVADGFEFTDELALEMLSDVLGYAYERELAARVVRTPSQDRIAKLQGYQSAA